MTLSSFSWNSLTWDQLLWLHGEGARRDGEPTIMHRFRVWMHLNGLELCGKSFYATVGDRQQPFLENEDLSVSELQNLLIAMSDRSGRTDTDTTTADGRNEDRIPQLVILFRTAKTSLTPKLSTLNYQLSTLFGAPIDELFYAVREHTAFLTEQTLVSLPAETITILGKEYQLPQPLLANITYEQFNTCSHALDSCFRALAATVPDASPSGSTIVPEGSAFGSPSSIPAAFPSGLTFLSHILTPLVSTPDSLSRKYEYLPELSEALAAQWQSQLMREARLSGRHSWRFRRRSSPLTPHPSPLNSQLSTLFPLLVLHFQSCLTRFKSMFPYVFTEGKGHTGAESPIVSELGTVNAIMKYQGYPSQQSVYQTNALLVFKVLDSMTREAKEMEKLKRKSHKK